MVQIASLEVAGSKRIAEPAQQKSHDEGSKLKTWKRIILGPSSLANMVYLCIYRFEYINT